MVNPDFEKLKTEYGCDELQAEWAEWHMQGDGQQPPTEPDESEQAQPESDEADDEPVSKAGKIRLSYAAPYDTARVFIEDKYRYFKFPDVLEQTLRCHQGQFYEWDGTHYAALDEKGHTIRARLYEFLDKAVVKSGEGYARFRPDQKNVGKVFHALLSAAHLEPDTRHPAWLGERCPVEDAKQLIACKNGLLHFQSGKLFEHDPRFWSHNVLPFEYDPAARCPRFMKFLEEILPGDPEAQATIQEIFGLSLTDETRFQKMFLIYGPRRSGKGTLGRVLRQLVGVENYVGPTLGGFAKDFGMQSWIGKKLAVIPDARLGRANIEAVERLLSVSGEDTLDINRKYLAAWTGVLSIRIIILTNELPKFEDSSGALASRFIVVQLRESFYDREQLDLTEELITELPGILNWAREGWVRLAGRQHFEQPKSGRQAAESLRIAASQTTAFVEALCELGSEYKIEIGTLHQSYLDFMVEHNIIPTGKTPWHFSAQLKAAYSTIEIDRPQSYGNPSRPRHFHGIRLKSPPLRLVQTDTESERLLDEPVVAANVVPMQAARR
jgi:putative DNA primase/helicase